MAQRKRRPYGSGCLVKRGKSWAIRWRQTEWTSDGNKRRVLRFETLGPISRKEANRILNERLTSASTIQPARITFGELATLWKARVLPMYKLSTKKGHTDILENKLLPRFRDIELAQIGRQAVQGIITDLTLAGYAPHTVHHVHNVASTLFSTAVKWGYIDLNPANNVVLPKLVTLRQRWVLTISQAKLLLEALPPQAKTIVGLAILTGLRRGEVFALRWCDFDESNAVLRIERAIYDGHIDTPKTAKSNRQLPLSPAALTLLREWKGQVSHGSPDDLVFATRTGGPLCPQNVLHRFVFPVCKRLGFGQATWLTFRRTYSSWAHDSGIPGKIVAELMGHSNVYTTLNIYTQVMPDSIRAAVVRIGDQLFTDCSQPAPTREMVH